MISINTKSISITSRVLEQITVTVLGVDSNP